ncbi:MAG: hypothetical protein CK529_13775 [Rhodospirillaceae bacterium]|nr:MAG: hypothetical protein CK529_13775 [Rhodospirillaceae bacterium]
MTEHRWSKFWWADWMRDPSLRSCSVAARGLWMDMLAIAFDGAPRGHVTIGRNPASLKQLAIIAGITEKRCTALLAELEQSEVFSRTDAGAIFSRRMVRDTDASEAGREAISRRWAKPTKEAPDPNSPPNREGHSPPHSLDAEADTEAEEEEESPPPVAPPKASAPRSASPTPAGRGCRIADDWTPADSGFAAEHGVDQAAALAEFRDYWRGVAGKAGVKLDWEATWRNQVRHLSAKKGGRLPVKTSQLPVADQNAELRRIMTRLRGEDDAPTQQPLRIVQ